MSRLAFPALCLASGLAGAAIGTAAPVPVVTYQLVGTVEGAAHVLDYDLSADDCARAVLTWPVEGIAWRLDCEPVFAADPRR